MVPKLTATSQLDAIKLAHSSHHLNRARRDSAPPRFAPWRRRVSVQSTVTFNEPQYLQLERFDREKELIERLHRRQFEARRRIFSRDLPFSWPRFLVGIISLALVFSDIPRSGLGIRTFAGLYPRIEPDTTIFFGSPWNYTVFEATRDEADAKAARVWSYKFDSTSIVWRVFAQFLNVSSFPQCLLYREQCADTHFGGLTAFTMIDDLVDALVAARRPRHSSGPTVIQVRSDNIYMDRVHNFLLPRLYSNHNWRTNQALHYSSKQLDEWGSRAICFPPSPAATPHFCQDQWINFRRSCPPSDPACQDVGPLYVQMMLRVRQVQARFPNLTVDLTVLESQEDFQKGFGSISALGIRRVDITSIIRARHCTSTGDCETLFVSDYRYEVGLLVSDAVGWYRLIAVLRVVGQSYFLVRAIGLVLSCYFAHGNTHNKSNDQFADRLNLARKLMMKVPTQCVVFGSPLPIVLYTLAHAIDASLMYTILENRFISQNGVFDLSMMDFISVAVIQMRSVWFYSLLWHAVVKAKTWTRWHGWSHIGGGIIGVPEFLLSGLASITIFSQFRSTTFRNSNVHSIFEVDPISGTSKLATIHQLHFVNRGCGTRQLGGMLIDFKFLNCIVGPIIAALLVRSLVVLVLESRGKSSSLSHWPLGTTPVPYSAGVLWPTASLCVHWTSDFYCIHEKARASLVSRFGRRMTQVLPVSTSTAAVGIHRRATHALPRYGSSLSLLSANAARMSLETFRFIQFQMERLDSRGDDVEANVAFMNLVLLSDPVVFFYTYVAGGGKMLGYYQSLHDPERVVLLPVSVFVDSNEHMIKFRALHTVNSATMKWAELIQCG